MISLFPCPEGGHESPRDQHRILFATDRLHVPDDHSGSVQSTHALASGLVRRGHTCQVAASLKRSARHFLATGVHRVSGRRIVLEWSDDRNGYPVHRGSQWRFTERVLRRLERSPADVLVLDSPRQLRLLLADGRGVPTPTVVMLHDPSFAREIPVLPTTMNVRFVANSPHTASLASAHLGTPVPVVPPVIHHDLYRTPRDQATSVTLVSPTKPKGVDLVLDLAERLPHVPFLLVEGWPMGRRDWTALRQRVARLPNVRLKRSTSDMRDVYRQTRILLVPSREHVETFGRVAVEAQISGIPVLACDVGALPWVVGAGGIVFSEQDDPTQWARELSALLQDGDRYGSLSRQALENSRRSDFQAEEVLARFEAVIRSLLAVEHE